MNKLIQNKKIVIIFGVLILLILAIIFPIYLLQNKQQQPNQVLIFRGPTPSSPTSQPQRFEITSITPPENINKTFFPIQQLEITFNLPVSASSIQYQIQPIVETFIFSKLGSDRIIILSPKIAWNIGLNTITISQSSTSNNGELLGKNYIYKIKAEYPETAPPYSPGL